MPNYRYAWLRAVRACMHSRTEDQSALLLDAPLHTPGASPLGALGNGSSERALGISADSEKGHRLVPILVALAVILTLLIIPFKVLSHGYLPIDDALRHAAKAVSGRAWNDVLVIQDQFQMDHNPGWHWLLGSIHRATGAGPDSLVVISVCSLILLFSFAPLGWLKRPEAWIASLLLGMVAFPGMLIRYYLARPLVFSVAATVVILLLWRKTEKPSTKLLAGTTVLFALATWIHGSWYLFALLVAAFALAGQMRNSLMLGGCWLGGSFLGALLTGHPFAFLWNAVNIGINCFGQHELQRMLVTEFQPADGAPLVVLLAASFLIVRGLSGRWSWTAVNNPIFMLFVLGWILGFGVSRFWRDWGLPAFSLWIALELQEHLQRHLPLQSYKRLLITGGLCVAFLYCVSGDVNERWTRQLNAEFLTESDPEMDPWLPEDGGILYSADMRTFYSTFFKNPHAKWRYALGFEPSFMLPDDLRIYRNIQWNYYSHSAYAPWVARMRPEDRLVIPLASTVAPSIPGLEWKYVARETWIGRLPRPATVPTGP